MVLSASLITTPSPSANVTVACVVPASIRFNSVPVAVIAVPPSVKELDADNVVKEPAAALAAPTVPSILALSVPVVIERAPDSAPVEVVVPIANAVEEWSQPIKRLLLSPLSMTIPASVVGVPVVPVANSSNLSSTVILVVETVVVVPLTVKLPVTVKLVSTVALPPTFKFSTIPTPPVTIKAPVFLLVLDVALVIVVAPLAANVVNAAVEADAAPMAVPSMAPPLISAVGITVEPVNVTEPLANVIKSASDVCPIVDPSIATLSTVRAVRVPTCVIWPDWSASTLNTWFVNVRPAPAVADFNCKPVLFSIADVPANWTAVPDTLSVVEIVANLLSAIAAAPAILALAILVLAEVKIVPVSWGSLIT